MTLPENRPESVHRGGKLAPADVDATQPPREAGRDSAGVGPEHSPLRGVPSSPDDTAHTVCRCGRPSEPVPVDADRVRAAACSAPIATVWAAEASVR